MPSPQEILADPNFHALPLGDRLKVLRTVDPNFAALPPKEQGTVIYQSAAALHPVTDTQPPQPEDQGFFSTIGKDLMAIPGGIIGTVQHPITALENATAARRALRPKATQALKEGNYMGAAGYGLASMMPFIGPAAAQAGEELGGGQTGQGAAHAAELLAPFAMRIPEVREKILPSEETMGTMKEYFTPKRWTDAKARYLAKKGGVPTRPQAQPVSVVPTTHAPPAPLPPIEPEEAITGTHITPQTIDEYLAQKRGGGPAPLPSNVTPEQQALADQMKLGDFSKLPPAEQGTLNQILMGRQKARPGRTTTAAPMPESLPAPAGAEVPAATAASAVSAPPAPTRPLHTEADVIDNFSTRRKVDNLTRHFWSKGVPYEELKAMYDRAKSTGNWDAIRAKELEAYASGKALEKSGNYNPLELVPKTPYKPPSGSQAAKEAGYTPQGVEGTWDRLLQRYPRTTPMQLGALPAPQPVAQ